MKKLAVLSIIVAVAITVLSVLTPGKSNLKVIELNKNNMIVLTPGKSNLKVIELNKNNMIVIDKEITSESVSDAMNQAKILDSMPNNSPIYVFLNTPGGSVDAGLNLIEYLNGLKRPVTTITLFAASMGFQMAEQLGDRYILSSGVLMTHHAKGQIQGEMGGSAGSQIDKRYNFWKSKLDELDQKVVDRSKGLLTLASYQAMYENELWLTGTQSVNQGFADEKVLVRCEDVGEDRKATMDFMGMRVSLIMPACPLDTNVRVDSSGLTGSQYEKAKEAFETSDWTSYNKAHVIEMTVNIK